MNIKTYIKDRIGFIILYFINTSLVILVMNLTFIIKRKEFTKDNTGYAFLLSFVILLFFGLFDYIRMKPFYRYLNKIMASKEDLNSILGEANYKSEEQRTYKDILDNSYRAYKDRLSKYEENQRQYTHFINQWVHQMKTPVSVINLLLQEGEEGNNKEMLESIAEENDIISHGLDMALHNARLSQFNLDFKVEQTDIAAISRNIINTHKKLLIKYSIFPKIIGEDNILVETDKKWISFVINQIILNAIKYLKVSEKENKYITINLKANSEKNILSIEDDGIGIPKEDIGRIFQPFFTGKNGRKTSESTGMGMYLSKRVCDELGHDLVVESEEGVGTKFSILFYKGRNIFKI